MKIGGIANKANKIRMKKNEIKLCKKLGILPQDAKQKIAFKSYDWQLYLENYKDN